MLNFSNRGANATSIAWGFDLLHTFHQSKGATRGAKLLNHQHSPAGPSGAPPAFCKDLEDIPVAPVRVAALVLCAASCASPRGKAATWRGIFYQQSREMNPFTITIWSFLLFPGNVEPHVFTLFTRKPSIHVECNSMKMFLYTVYCIPVCTAQGGSGSFKYRKPIGEVRCCESWMAEQIH